MKGKNKKTKKITKQKTKQKKMLRSKQQQQKIPTKPRGIQPSPSPRLAYTRTEGARPPGGAGEWLCLAGGAVGTWPGTGEDLEEKSGQWVWGGGAPVSIQSSFPTLLPRQGVPRVDQAPEKEQPADLGYCLLSPEGSGAVRGQRLITHPRSPAWPH